MSAKEMFEELGYKCTRNDHLFISYVYLSKCYKNYYYNIEFSLKYKEITVRRYKGNFFRRIYSNEDMIGFYLDDIQAINKQIEELGWLNETILRVE